MLPLNSATEALLDDYGVMRVQARLCAELQP